MSDKDPTDRPSPNAGKPIVIQNLDVLMDMDDASHALYEAAANLRQMGLIEESKELVSLADQILSKQAILRHRYGRF